MTDHPKFRQTEDGTLLLNFGEYGREVEVAAISGDGRRVLTVKEVGTAEVWELESGTRVGVLQPTSPLEGSRDAAPMGSTFQVFIEAAALNADGTLDTGFVADLGNIPGLFNFQLGLQSDGKIIVTGRAGQVDCARTPTGPSTAQAVAARSSARRLIR